MTMFGPRQGRTDKAHCPQPISNLRPERPLRSVSQTLRPMPRRCRRLFRSSSRAPSRRRIVGTPDGRTSTDREQRCHLDRSNRKPSLRTLLSSSARRCMGVRRQLLVPSRETGSDAPSATSNCAIVLGGLQAVNSFLLVRLRADDAASPWNRRTSGPHDDSALHAPKSVGGRERNLVVGATRSA
jgi:hypothetical protein